MVQCLPNFHEMGGDKSLMQHAKAFCQISEQMKLVLYLVNDVPL